MLKLKENSRLKNEIFRGRAQDVRPTAIQIQSSNCDKSSNFKKYRNFELWTEALTLDRD